MFLRLSAVQPTAGSTSKMPGGRNYQTIENSHGWNMSPSVNAFRASDDIFVLLFRNGGAMRTKQYERRYPHGDLLNGEARAVIEAEFEEINIGTQKCSFTQLMKDGLQWIKQRLQRA